MKKKYILVYTLIIFCTLISYDSVNAQKSHVKLLQKFNVPKNSVRLGGEDKILGKQEWYPYLRSIATCGKGCISQLDPKFGGQIMQTLKAAEGAGFKPKIISGFRSVAHQAKLYARYKSGAGGLAAKPGSSRHNIGQAGDIDDSSGKQKQFLEWMWKNSPGFGILNPPSIRSRDGHHFQLNGPGTKGFQPDNSQYSPNAQDQKNNDAGGSGGGSGGGDQGPPGGGSPGSQPLGSPPGGGGSQGGTDPFTGNEGRDGYQDPFGPASTSEDFIPDDGTGHADENGVIKYASTTSSSTSENDTVSSTGTTNGISNALIDKILDDVDMLDKASYRFLLGHLKPGTPAGAIYGLNPRFVQCTSALIRSAEISGNNIKIKSGYRPKEIQARIYQKALIKYPNSADIYEENPDISTHVNGIALDLVFETKDTQKWLYAHSKEFGINFPNKSVPEHATSFSNLCASNTPSTYGQNIDKNYQANTIKLPHYYEINPTTIPQISIDEIKEIKENAISTNTIKTPYEKRNARRFFFENFFKNKQTNGNTLEKINTFFTVDDSAIEDRTSWFNIILRMIGLR